MRPRPETSLAMAFSKAVIQDLKHAQQIGTLLGKLTFIKKKNPASNMPHANT